VSATMTEVSTLHPLYKAELKLEPKRTMPRRLTIQLLLSGDTLWVHLATRRFQPLSSGHCRLKDCYLALGDIPSLCLRESDFRVTSAEAAKIRAIFEPLGLKIWEDNK
jgi:hypothetical protein